MKAKKVLVSLLTAGMVLGAAMPAYAKDETTVEVKDYYDNKDFDMNDVVKISRGTTKQDELFDYVEAPDYLKTRVKGVDDYDRDYDKSDDFDLSR